MTLSKRIICGLALTAMASVPLYAKVVTDTTRPGNFNFTLAGTLIPLNGGGATSIAFNGKGKHIISYSAECETTGSWLSIEILVDGVALSPTAGAADAFCSDHKTAESLDAWTTASYVIATPALAAGVHTVQVRGTVQGNGGASDTGWLGDSSLVIEK
jgi:hypothetical protein